MTRNATVQTHQKQGGTLREDQALNIRVKVILKELKVVADALPLDPPVNRLQVGETCNMNELID